MRTSAFPTIEILFADDRKPDIVVAQAFRDALASVLGEKALRSGGDDPVDEQLLYLMSINEGRHRAELALSSLTDALARIGKAAYGYTTAYAASVRDLRTAEPLSTYAPETEGIHDLCALLDPVNEVLLGESEAKVEAIRDALEIVMQGEDVQRHLGEKAQANIEAQLAALDDDGKGNGSDRGKSAKARRADDQMRSRGGWRQSSQR
ncbi:MAG: hypothetical protein V1908_01830 [Candidatus Peregrinibacteria bacterium]